MDNGTGNDEFSIASYMLEIANQRDDVLRRIAVLEAENQRLWKSADALEANNNAIHAENQRLRAIMQRWYDDGYDRRENEQALAQGVDDGV